VVEKSAVQAALASLGRQLFSSMVLHGGSALLRNRSRDFRVAIVLLR
jgi:hypothetical protein